LERISILERRLLKGRPWGLRPRGPKIWRRRPANPGRGGRIFLRKKPGFKLLKFPPPLTNLPTGKELPYIVEGSWLRELGLWFLKNPPRKIRFFPQIVGF